MTASFNTAEIEAMTDEQQSRNFAKQLGYYVSIGRNLGYCNRPVSQRIGDKISKRIDVKTWGRKAQVRIDGKPVSEPIELRHTGSTLELYLAIAEAMDTVAASNELAAA